LFSLHDFDIGNFSAVKHSIDIKESAPIQFLTRRVPLALEDKVSKMVEKMLQNNIIRRSNSEWNSPLVIVPKKDGDIRICLDYRKLNQITKRPIFHIPSAQEIFDRLGGNAVFSTLDLSKGYYQIPMSDEDSRKTAFSTPCGHYEFTRMPFGLCGAPATFQRALTSVLHEEVNKICCIYLDDIIVFGKTKDEHDCRLRKVLQKLDNAGLKLSKQKCTFGCDTVRFLGHEISKDGVKTDPEKIEKIKNWPTPITFAQLHSFIGFANYYRRFIKDYYSVVRPLLLLLEENRGNHSKRKIQWNQLAIDSFKGVKQALCSQITLSLPASNCTYILDTDASEFGIGGVLSQIVNGQEKVLFFASNSLTSTERNYCTTRRELLAVVQYLRKFRHYLMGRKFILRTDHRSLTWLMSWKDPSSSQYFSWIEEIMQFDFEIQHRPGKLHSNADALSRLAECGQCKIKHNNPKPKRARIITSRNDFEDLKKYIRGEVSLTQIQENIYRPYIQYIAEKNGTLFFNKAGVNCLVIDDRCGYTLASKMHSSLAHVGFSKLYNSLRNHYFWPSMKNHISSVVSSCKFCLQRKDGGQFNHEKKSLESEYTFQKIYADITGPLPITKNGYRYILAIIDGFSKWTSLIPLKSLSSINVKKAFLYHWISIFGAPEKLHTDRGTHFVNDQIKQMCNEHHIKHSLSSPYYPLGNSVVERQFKTIKDLLFCTSKENCIDWEESLWIVQRSLRFTFNDSVNMSPYEAIFYRSPRLNNSITKNVMFERIQKNLIKKFEKSCSKNMSNKLSDSKFKIGDKLYAKILPIKKGVYLPKFDGPYIVKEIRGSGLILKNVANGKIIARNEHHVKRTPQSENEKKLKYFCDPNIKPSANEREPNTHQLHRYPERRRQSPNRLGFQ